MSNILYALASCKNRSRVARYRGPMAQRDRFGGVRLWVAPALGLGLVVAGGSVALGLKSGFAPLLAAGVAAVVLSIGKWRETALARERAARDVR